MLETLCIFLGKHEFNAWQSCKRQICSQSFEEMNKEQNRNHCYYTTIQGYPHSGTTRSPRSEEDLPKVKRELRGP